MHGRPQRLLGILVIVCTAALALAPRRAAAEGGPFGLGLILGSPTGFSAKLYLNRRNALDFALGFSFLNRRGVAAHVDYLWHPVMLADDEAFFLPLYVGVGARILDHDRGNDDDDLHLGARAPAGILFDFKAVPLDVFLEVALVVDIIQDHGDVIDLNAGVGVRYYF
jgi:hypothetical protein